MIFNVDKKDILNSLNLVSTIIDKKSNIQVLSNVYIKAYQDGTIELEGSNLLNHIRTKVKGVVLEHGTLTVSAIKFLSMIKEADGEICIKYNGGSVAHMSFDNVKTELAVTPHEDFPNMRKIEGKASIVNSKVLANKLNKAVCFVSADETRKMLTGVHLKTNENELKVAATNSHHLFASSSVGDFEKGLNVILPYKSAKLIQSICLNGGDDDGDVSIVTNDLCLSVKYGDYELFTKLIDAKYPAYEAIIPDYEGCASVDRSAIKRNIRLASIIMDDFEKSVSLTFENGKVTIQSKNTNSEKVTNSMPAEYNGNRYDVIVNSEYLTNIINNLTGKSIDIYFNVEESNDKPLIFKSEHEDSGGDIYLVMPVRD